MRKSDIVEEIVVLLKNKFGVQSKDIGHISLLDPEIGMLPRDLFTLFFDLQKKYGIKFVESDVIDKRFDYFNELTEIVYQKIKEKNS
ncbi:hypothetical protein IMSAGC011_01366 [Lachnospiraceae bacterium]|nr:hypothetical protein IMSAGC011_01366 [Lachnospiraceae bacterium]